MTDGGARLLPAGAPAGTADETLMPARRMNAARLVLFMLAYTGAAPTGLEGLLKHGSGAAALGGLVLVPLLYTAPQILVTIELSAMMPSQGGPVAWVVRGLGGRAGFAFCWLQLVQFVADIAASVAVSSTQLRWMAYRDVDHTVADIACRVAVLVVATLTALLSLDQASRVFMPAIVFVNAVLIVGFCATMPRWRDNFVDRSDPDEVDWTALVTNLLWQYTGIMSLAASASEVKSSRALAIGLWCGLLILASVFIAGILMMLAMSDSNTDLSLSSQPFIITAFNRALPGGGYVFAVALILLSVANIATSLMANGRFLWAVAKLGWAPAFFTHQHYTTAAPARAVVCMAVLTLPFVVLRLSSILGMLYTCAAVGIAMVPLAAGRLRLYLPDIPRPRRVPGGNAGIFLVVVLQVAFLATVLIVGVIAKWYVLAFVGSVLFILLLGATVFWRFLEARLVAQAAHLRDDLIAAGLRTDKQLTEAEIAEDQAKLRKLHGFERLARAELPMLSYDPPPGVPTVGGMPLAAVLLRFGMFGTSFAADEATAATEDVDDTSMVRSSVELFDPTASRSRPPSATRTATPDDEEMQPARGGYGTV